MNGKLRAWNEKSWFADNLKYIFAKILKVQEANKLTA